jgi:phosphatidylserine/phosphatidylglycerophosphate/cardiolipin synthase-like enzyme
MSVLKPGINCGAPCAVRDARLLIDGKSYYRAFYHAALRARRFIFLAGWRFDSSVALLRGGEAGRAPAPFRLLPLLEHLCERNRFLRVYVLAWDFNMMYALDREMFQKREFEKKSRRISFLFDGRHPLGASHHQKFAVIDGAVAFLGGMDLCAWRWDDRRHLPENPLRVDPEGRPYEAHHDMQACLEGEAAGRLAGIFARRWKVAGGESLEHLLERAGDGRPGYLDEAGGVALDPAPVCFSLTMPPAQSDSGTTERQILGLYRDAILGAESILYLENQYFSSRLVYRALVKRIRNPEKPGLQIVMVLPREPHTFLETVALVNREAALLKGLKEEAGRHGHRIGVYYTVPGGAGNGAQVYVHAKLLLADHRLLTLGSANLADRSMGLDSELNVSWEGDLRDCLRRLAAELLAEHTGRDRSEVEANQPPEGDLVGYLDRCAADESCRLCALTEQELFRNREALGYLLPRDFAVDPEAPLLEEGLFEEPGSGAEFARGAELLRKLFPGRTEKREGSMSR